MKYLIICLLFTFSVSAQQLTVLKKDEIAPYDGVLVDDVQMKKFRQINEDKKTLETKFVLQEDLLEIKDQRINFYKKKAEEAYKEVQAKEGSLFLTKTGYFILGVAATSLAAYAAIQATK